MPVRIDPPPAGAMPRVREEAPYVAVAPDPGAPPTFSVVVPVREDGGALAGSVRDLLGALEDVGEPFEILVVGDGGRVADDLAAADRRVRVFQSGSFTGIGAALRTGIRAARGTYVVTSPPESPLDADQIRAFLEVMEPGASFAYLPGRRACDVAVGCRTARPGASAPARLAAWAGRWLMRVGFRAWLRDFTWICMYRRSLFERIDFESNDLAALPEILVRAKRAGLRLQQIPYPVRAPSAPRSLSLGPGPATAAIARLWLRLHFGSSRAPSPIKQPES